MRGSLAALALVALAAPVLAAPVEEAKPIIVEAGSSHHLRLGATIARVSVGSTDTADVAPFPPDQLLVTGKRVGQTTVTVWYRNDEVSIFTIRVTHPVSAMNDALARAIPDSKDVRATSAGSAVVLTGEVPAAADIEHAEAIVRGVGGEATQIVDLLRVPGDNQVQLEVSFAEVSRSALKEIGVNLWAKDQNGAAGPQWSGGLLNPSSNVNGIAAAPSSTTTDTLSLASGLQVVQTPLTGAFGAVFATAAGSKFPFSAALSVLAEKGYARTLSEPTLVALSGHPASFLAGGEFPVPMPQSLGQIGIDYRKFGVQLDFIPTIEGQNIQLRMSTTVSDIDFTSAVKLATVSVPGLTERHSETTVRLRDGESFAIAGLLSDQVRSTIDKVPGLGDIPLLGSLFRSTSYRRQETELLVVVTAHLVRPGGDKPVLPGEDTLADPSDLELFLLGTIESKEGGDERLHPHKRAKPQGPVGFAR